MIVRTFRGATLTVIVVAAAVITAPDIGAQGVQGRVRDAGSGRPLDGAVVSLVPEAPGSASVGSFTDSSGAYRLRPTTAGLYRLNIKRIGYTPYVSPVFEITLAAQLVQPDVALAPRPQVVATVNIIGDRRCASGSRRGEEVVTLWEDVRVALEATVFTAEEQRFALSYITYERALDRQLREQRRTDRQHVARGAMVFASVPSDQLASEGYVVTAGDEATYRGLDAHVLLSESFLETHCFRSAPKHETDTALIGLAFEPVRRGSRIDVRGVLWVDRSTRALDAIEFTYEGLNPLLPQKNLGGRVEFEQLPSGRWLVDRWWIRMPRIMPGAPNRMRRGRTSLSEVLDGYQEVGGAVFDIMTGAAADTLLVARPRIAGTIRDSSAGRWLTDAIVVAGDTTRTVHTDSTGAFDLIVGSRSEIRLVARHPRLDSLGFGEWSWTIPPDTTLVRNVALAIPPVAQLLAIRCGETPLIPGETVIVGRVDDGTNAVQGARIRAIWSVTVIGAAGVERSERERTAVSDANGRFAICGLPPETTLRVEVTRDGNTSLPLSVRTSETQPWTSLELRLAPPTESRTGSAPAVEPPGSGFTRWPETAGRYHGRPSDGSPPRIFRAASTTRTKSAR